MAPCTVYQIHHQDAVYQTVGALIPGMRGDRDGQRFLRELEGLCVPGESGLELTRQQHHDGVHLVTWTVEGRPWVVALGDERGWRIYTHQTRSEWESTWFVNSNNPFLSNPFSIASTPTPPATS